MKLLAKNFFNAQIVSHCWQKPKKNKGNRSYNGQTLNSLNFCGTKHIGSIEHINDVVFRKRNNFALSIKMHKTRDRTCKNQNIRITLQVEEPSP